MRFGQNLSMQVAYHGESGIVQKRVDLTYLADSVDGGRHDDVLELTGADGMKEERDRRVEGQRSKFKSSYTESLGG